MRATAAKPAQVEILDIPFSLLDLHPLNPRDKADYAGPELDELVASLKASGQMTTATVRATAKGRYEVLAGNRRTVAAPKAGFTTLRCEVRELSDTAALVFLLSENLRRKDIHPMREARGIAELLKNGRTPDGAPYTVAIIAAEFGQSERYVYDRTHLLKLIPDAQQLFLDHVITLGHAVAIARETSDAQARIVEPVDGAIWQNTAVVVSDSEEESAELALKASKLPPAQHNLAIELATGGRKVISVKELEHFIAHHVRFNRKAEHVALLFPESKELLDQAAERKEKVISITHSHALRPEAKAPDGERTFGNQSWVRADGKEGSKTCDRSVIGSVDAGEGRGEVFRVCADKQRCEVHYGKEIRARQKREKERERGDSVAAAKGETPEQRKARAAKAAEKALVTLKTAQNQWKAARPIIVEQLSLKLKKLPVVTGVIADALINACNQHSELDEKSLGLSRGKTAEDLIRWLVARLIEDHLSNADRRIEEATDWWTPKPAEDVARLAKNLKPFGVDVAKIYASAARAGATAPPSTAKKGSTAKASKKKAKR